MSTRIFRPRRLACLALLVLAASAGSALPAAGSESPLELQPAALARAKAIRAELNVRYRRLSGRKLRVTDATTTGTIESFTLHSGPMDAARTVSAANGIWFAVCPARATCPYPGRRFARPAADFLARRLALELAVRTFLETSVDLVAVALPTRQFTMLVVERGELTDLPSLARALRGKPSTSQLGLVDRLTRPRVFIGIGLEATPAGGLTLVAFPWWPDAVEERR